MGESADDLIRRRGDGRVVYVARRCKVINVLPFGCSRHKKQNILPFPSYAFFDVTKQSVGKTRLLKSKSTNPLCHAQQPYRTTLLPCSLPPGACYLLVAFLCPSLCPFFFPLFRPFFCPFPAPSLLSHRSSFTRLPLYPWSEVLCAALLLPRRASVRVTLPLTSPLLTFPPFFLPTCLPARPTCSDGS